MTIAIPAQQERDRRCLAVLGTAHGALRTSFLSSVPKASPRGSPLPVRRCVPVPPRVLAPRFPPRAPAARGQQRLRRRLGGRGHRSPGRSLLGVWGERPGWGVARCGAWVSGLQAETQQEPSPAPRSTAGLSVTFRPAGDALKPAGAVPILPLSRTRGTRLALPCSGLGQRALLPPP